MKVKIKVQNGQTGLRKVGSIVDINPKTAKLWEKYGYAERVNKPRKKKKSDAKSNKDTDG